MHGFVEPKPFLRALWYVQRGLCFHCNKPMIFTENGGQGQPKALMATREHIHPRGLNGNGMHRNIVLAHASCNNQRGCREPTQEELTKTKAIYMILGLTPFVPFGDDGKYIMDAHQERQMSKITHAAKHKLDTFQAPTMHDLWPTGK